MISPLLSNVYLAEVDQMLERAKDATRSGRFSAVEYARFADDLVVLVDAHPRHAWMRQAVPVRLRQELAKLRVEINEEKSKTVDLDRGDSFGFLGFEFRRIRALRGVWRPNFAPKLKKRTALLAKLREVFRRYRSQPIRRVVDEINPIVRGLGELLLGGAFQRLLQLRQRLGGEEDSTSHAAGPETSRLRLAEVEYAMAVRNVGVVQHYRVRYYTPKASASG